MISVAPVVASVVFSIPGLPPSANHAYQHVTYGSKTGASYTGRRLTPKAEHWRTQAATIVRVAAARAGVTIPRRRPLAVVLVFQTPRPYNVDLDNLQKLAIDAIAEGLEVDDRYIVSITSWKERDEDTSTTGQVDLLQDPAARGAEARQN